MSQSMVRPVPGRRLWAVLAAIGPGLIVMLADTDAGSIITAAQSGAQWGYRLLLLQALLIPVLYVVQEMTVRLALVTGKGHGELIRETFGVKWAWFSCSTLLLACLGALISEFSGMAGVGQLFGIPAWQTMLVLVGGMVLMIWTRSYRSVERIAVAFGACELVFLYVALKAHPDGAALVDGLRHMPLGDHKYLYLVAANIGAVIMPWMVFFQQSALVEKELGPSALKIARRETVIGAVVTQIVMAAVLVAAAATIGTTNPNAPLDTVQQISDTLVPYLGWGVGRAVFVLGMTGAAMVAAIVVALTAAWGVGEVAGYRRSLADHPREAPWFYGILTACLVLAGGLVASNAVNLVNLSVGVEVLNALLLPVVLGFLYALARKALPEEYRLKGGYGLVAGAVVLVTAGFGVFSAVSSFFA
ncbi:divalent metal cation transporter MntH [mine drainage metagenome]|uniref:Divalent metal cation transporter MntH n=1 Tax=mine drainage metagenome TaxID=410659 RepID=A0A1J5RPW6_9ZZZZ